MTDYSTREFLSDVREAGLMLEALEAGPLDGKPCILCGGTGERVVDGEGWSKRTIDCNLCSGFGRVE